MDCVTVCWWACKASRSGLGSHSGLSVPPAPARRPQRAAGLPENQAGLTGAGCGLTGKEADLVVSTSLGGVGAILRSCLGCMGLSQALNWQHHVLCQAWLPLGPLAGGAGSWGLQSSVWALRPGEEIPLGGGRVGERRGERRVEGRGGEQWSPTYCL